MECDLCNKTVKNGVAVIKQGVVTEESLCSRCSYTVFPRASAEAQLFVKHMEDYHNGILARDAGARGYWNACKDYLKSRDLL